ncbi:hypothetical protein F4678DRAFT_456922 [Xylaria arbuscula]|nr:hypothetical protein F4678DRAFT_456922 [Xylaria arbuscula]
MALQGKSAIVMGGARGIEAGIVRALAKNGANLNDRVKLIEGPADESLKKLTGQFDLIFVDANKEGYEGHVKYILDNKLLSPSGLIMCDNVFARGMTIPTEANPQLPAKVRPYWTENGKALRKFCDFCKDDELVDVVLLPLFDGTYQL